MNDPIQLVSFAVHMLCGLAWLGTAVYVYARTRSAGGVVLTIHAIANVASGPLWLLLPQFLMQRLPGEHVSVILATAGSIYAVVAFGLLITGVLLLLPRRAAVDSAPLP